MSITGEESQRGERAGKPGLSPGIVGDWARGGKLFDPWPSEGDNQSQSSPVCPWCRRRAARRLYSFRSASMLHPQRRRFALGVAALLCGLPALAQEAKKENPTSAMERALEQSKLTGLPILAVAGTET
jgi:hypothetical protein